LKHERPESAESQMPEVNIKKELSTLDRNNWDAVSDLVDRIVDDIIEVSEIACSNTWEFEALKGLMEDYMIELINPDLLDFNSKEKNDF
jgi:hypothetical protein